MKAVFDTKPSSSYDDNITQHYQIPRRYLKIAQQCKDDWIVLRRPRADGGNLAYFATAKVEGIEVDEGDPRFAYVRLTSFLPFDPPVSWRRNGRYAEQALRELPQHEVGVYLRGRSVRALSDVDFLDLIVAGLGRTLGDGAAAAFGETLSSIELSSFKNDELPETRQLRIGAVLTNRIIREVGFRRNVCTAYDNRCSISRFKISDRAGAFEVQAAHIVPVSDGGPDVVQNGIAMSATFHWLFDRHLFSITDEYEVLFDDAHIPLAILDLFNGDNRRIHLPSDSYLRPHPKFLKKHREKYYNLKGGRVKNDRSP
ncbi:HNH endonuclease [Agrobacterium tumefaciens]|uniref:HNH endonuclease n=1 Tax=Agrobacterium tumefaciens TaxID=358 RepID=UPI0021CFFEC0|nr:HNH endonuclease [Agrobacterium tumefaciens]UXT64176.1 HNH endonuclease [Agrobacterium tumefaciens]